MKLLLNDEFAPITRPWLFYLSTNMNTLLCCKDHKTIWRPPASGLVFPLSSGTPRSGEGAGGEGRISATEHEHLYYISVLPTLT
jgi:hypothetical protein